MPQRTSDGKPICWLCSKIGHISYRCLCSSRSLDGILQEDPVPRDSSRTGNLPLTERSNNQSSQSSRGTPSPNRERQEQQTAQYGPRGHGKGINRSSLPPAPRGCGRGFYVNLYLQ